MGDVLVVDIRRNNYYIHPLMIRRAPLGIYSIL